MNEEIKQEEGQTPELKLEKPIEKMTVLELREIGLKIPGLEGVHAMKKEELLPLIREYYGLEEEVPAKGRPVKAKKTALSVAEMKQKLRELRAAKETARENREAGRVDILRRRINRLKKATRITAKA